MKNLATAFSMVWGNFTVLPCPYKRWDSKLNNMMLMLLPMVGAVLGGIWMLLVWGMRTLELPVELAALISTLYAYGVCGFMHLDGYMDCSDAILSRRPLEDRQRILKDSRVGAFAVVMVVFLILSMYVCMQLVVYKVNLLCFFLLPVLSRYMAGMEVMLSRPIGHSQYTVSFRDSGKIRDAIIMFLLVVACALIYCYLAESLSLNGIGWALAEILAASITAAYAKWNLGGMSGDIAGLTICVSELAAVVALSL